MTTNEILNKYTTGEMTLPEANEALKEADSDLYLDPNRNVITPEELAETRVGVTPDEANGYGLMDYGAAWALIENMLLAATAEGLGSVVHIPVKKEPGKIKEFLKAPDGWTLPALVVLGYPVQDPLLPAQVKATVENRVHWNKW